MAPKQPAGALNKIAKLLDTPNEDWIELALSVTRTGPIDS
jgi:hypothetical protein